jgi:predicted dinucleotide-binding enzyme
VAVRIVRVMTRIGVIGSGNIGETVGEAWRRAGHEVVYGSRSTVATAHGHDR